MVNTPTDLRHCQIFFQFHLPMASFDVLLFPIHLQYEMPGEAMAIVCPDGVRRAHVSVMYENSIVYRNMRNDGPGNVIRLYCSLEALTEALQWIYADTMISKFPEYNDPDHAEMAGCRRASSISEDAHAVLMALRVTKYATVPIKGDDVDGSDDEF